MAVRKRVTPKGTVLYMVDIVLPNGKRIRKHIGPSKKQAEQVHKKIMSEIVEGTWGIQEQKMIQFCELVPLYLEYCELNKSASTVRSDRSRMEGHLLSYFGDLLLNQITVALVESYKGMRIREGASAKTVNHDLSLLQSMIKFAQERDHVRDNMVARVKKLKLAKNPPRYLSHGEIERLLEAARGSHLRPLLETALATGMRKSELFNLKWTDIDFEQDTVTVQSKEDWHTKNYKARALALTPRLRRVLIEQRRDQEVQGFNSEYVLTYEGRKLLATVKKSLKTVLRKAGLKNVTLHTLRHTFASQLCMAGVSLKAVQELMGHASFETTLQYAHLSKDHVKKQVLRLPFAGD